MESAVRVVGWLETVEFVVLALVVARIWRRQRSATSDWLAATFFTIAAVVVIGQFLPKHPTGVALGFLVRVLIVAIVAFPYLLYRFTLTFTPARFPRARRAVDVGMLGLVAWTALLRHIPMAGEHRSVDFDVFIAAVTVAWVGLTVTVALLLWRWSSGQPPVARSRMRTMSVASGLLALALLVGLGSNSATPGGPALVSGLLVLLTVPLFLVGVSPPAPLLAQWRSRDRQRLITATIDLVEAATPAAVADALLPQLTDFLGGSGAALLDADGQAWASHALAAEQLQVLADLCPREPGVREQVLDGSVWVATTTGWLVVETTRFTPFFGADDVRVLESMAAVADIALTRIESLAVERAHVEAIRDFVAIASHELRTPITAVSGFTQLLQRRWDQLPDGERQEIVGAVGRQGGVLMRLVEDLLTVSRIDGGALTPTPELLDVETSVRAVLDDLGVEGVAVSMSEPGQVLMDPEHLRRVLTNYVRNAAVHGAPPILVEAFRRSGRVTIQVRDHGPGVPAEFEPRLFGKFARADKKTSRAVGGTGLGLSIVDGLARAAGGEAFYEPARGGGSVFGITVPAVPQQSGSEPQWRRAEFSSSSRTKPTSAG